MKKISNSEIKGASDWLPEEFAVRKYIFDSWRRVCKRYGFEEYLTPLLEKAEIYRAKSGEDVGGKELLVFKDLGDRELAIRPEMTPSVVRLVSKNYKSEAKPIKYFSIANFFRNEKPQRGRNREFWQLNCDIFGTDSEMSDLEMIELAIDIILEFSPPKNSFILKINNRKLLDEFLNYIQVEEKNRVKVLRILDKKEKLSINEFEKSLKDIGLSDEQINNISIFLEGKKGDNFLSLINSSEKLTAIYQELISFISKLQEDSYGDYIIFDPSIIRGFDYYNGIVFEVFDLNPENNRAIFGGGRYDGLAKIFGEENFPALGFAPGDETTKLFLESWGLLDDLKNKLNDNLYYLPIIDSNLKKETRELAKILREEGKNVLVSYEEQKIAKAFKFAQKKNIKNVIIFGSQEKENNCYKLKDLKSGLEKNINIKNNI